MRKDRILVIGYGNTARGDDGVAPAFVERVASLELPFVETRIQFQLCVEDALDVGDYDQVVFVDASVDVLPPFDFSPLGGNAVKHLDTHTLTPGALMHLAGTLFGAQTKAFVLSIRGYCFEPFRETLTEQAWENLDGALRTFLAHCGAAGCDVDGGRPRNTAPTVPGSRG